MSERLGYQPSLDGLRAISVIAVLLYHAGFTWMRGGFLGVEVFFVISGFLITALLMEERESSGAVSLRGFWARRARRLFPALIAVVMAVAFWVMAFGSDQDRSDMRRELPWSVVYANNWGQIFGGTPYFSGETSMLRHLWSLAVEEQWYVLWPLAFVAMAKIASGRWRNAGLVVLAAAGSSMLAMHVIARGGAAPLGGPLDALRGVDRTNFLYLSTVTRSGGLLLGAAGAMLLRPWRVNAAPGGVQRWAMSAAGGGALAVLVAAFVWGDITDSSTYRWVLPAVSASSVLAVATSVQTDSGRLGRLLSARWLVVVGTRSYGLYLWSWPISVAVGAVEGSVPRFVLAMAIAVPVTELSFRFVETPLRTWRWEPAAVRRSAVPFVSTSVAIGIVAISAFYVGVEPFDPFAGDDIATFDAEAARVRAPTSGPAVDAPVSTRDVPPATTSPATTTTATTTTATTTPAPAATAATTTTTTPPPALSARLAIVGDSTANALAVNAPIGIDEIYPQIINGSFDGCSVFDTGRVLTEAAFRNEFARCSGWQQTWQRNATDADVVLVVIGAWDVFDIEVGERIYAFASEDGDSFFSEQLRSGIDALLATNVRVALLEIPCMRPIESSGSRLPPLPERGEDWRVAHTNDLMRAVAQGYGPTVAFIDGPSEWCDDPTVANDTRLRWDGVHVYGEGAKLTYETTAAAILQLAALPLE